LKAKEIKALKKILDLIVPEFELLGFNKASFINLLIAYAKIDKSSSLKLMTIYSILKRCYEEHS